MPLLTLVCDQEAQVDPFKLIGCLLNCKKCSYPSTEALFLKERTFFSQKSINEVATGRVTGSFEEVD